MQHRLLQLNGSRKHGKPNGSRKLNGSRKHGNKGTIHGHFLDEHTGPIDDKSLMQIGAIVLETLAFFYVFFLFVIVAIYWTPLSQREREKVIDIILDGN